MNQGIHITELENPFITESGFRFENAPVAYKTWGNLNAERNNVILIFHALTGHAAADEWFPGIFGVGNICDADEHFIICINVPGSCYGTVGPQSINPKNGKPYRNDFPEITIRDMVRFQQQFLDQLRITGIELVIGGSMGGMQALEFIIMDRRARSAVLIAMGKAHTPWAIGISHAQRVAIKNDPKWKGGNYNLNDEPFKGVTTARMMAMITYRAPEDYNRKFGRKLQNEDGQFQIESYLNYQGEKLAKRMNAHTYIILTKAMDSHDISHGRENFEQILDRVEIPVQIIGITSDHLYPIAEQKELAELLPNGRYAEIDSLAGHDGFLIEFEQLNQIIKPFTQRKELLIY